MAWAAVEARALGRGGIARVAEATGLSRATISAGLQELATGPADPPGSVARAGRGPQGVAEHDATWWRRWKGPLDDSGRHAKFRRSVALDLLACHRGFAANSREAAPSVSRTFRHRTGLLSTRLVHVISRTVRRGVRKQHRRHRDAHDHSTAARAFQRRAGQWCRSGRGLVGPFENGPVEWRPARSPRAGSGPRLSGQFPGPGGRQGYGVYDLTHDGRLGERGRSRHGVVRGGDVAASGGGGWVASRRARSAPVVDRRWGSVRTAALAPWTTWERSRRRGCGLRLLRSHFPLGRGKSREDRVWMVTSLERWTGRALAVSSWVWEQAGEPDRPRTGCAKRHIGDSMDRAWTVATRGTAVRGTDPLARRSDDDKRPPFHGDGTTVLRRERPRNNHFILARVPRFIARRAPAGSASAEGIAAAAGDAALRIQLRRRFPASSPRPASHHRSPRTWRGCLRLGVDACSRDQTRRACSPHCGGGRAERTRHDVVTTSRRLG